MAKRRRVAVALGSGGARGYAHIGVLNELDARGFEVVSVSGSSMGALVGGLYCAGKLDDYVDWTRKLTQLDIVRLLDISLSKPGVIAAEKVLARVREILGDVMIEDLSIPFTAVATDLNAGRSVWFQRGSLVDAIRASIAIPGVISPHVYDGRVFGDGGILDALPISPTTSVVSDLTIGVILGSDGVPDMGFEPAAVDTSIRPDTIWRRSSRTFMDSDFMRSVRDRFGIEPPPGQTELPMVDEAGQPIVAPVADAARPAERQPGDGAADPATVDPSAEILAKMGRFDVLSRSLDIMQDTLTRYQLARNPPDLMIRVPRKSVRTLDFHKAGEMIELGRRLAVESLDRLDAGSGA
ncbi:esterase [Gordonia sp. TBRC 11910]|uniref:Esterase n=1 Tax=Gordonia asplenii TaxID=2725283 RepID=A0A848KRC2_9ACTN|nr:patatin-like phospholipase family protein [Gordonia asplenii]NMO00619.1 esterase [Gordonia asplenii]